MWPALAILGSGILSAGAQIFGANSAAKTQAKSAQYATDAQLAMFGITRASLQPFINTGSKASNLLATNLRGLMKPINMSQANLEATPGYKFTLGQGEKAVENAASARGLGASGAALKGAADYATGLSDKTYNERFANALANKQFAYNSLIGTSGLGANAAAGLGYNATATGGQIGSNAIGAGNAQAGADIAGANAATGLGNSLVAAILQAQKSGQGTNPVGVYS